MHHAKRKCFQYLQILILRRLWPRHAVISAPIPVKYKHFTNAL